MDNFEEYDITEEDFALGRAIDLASEELLKNKEFVLTAISYGSRGILQLDKKILNDIDVIRANLTEGTPINAYPYLHKEALKDTVIRKFVLLHIDLGLLNFETVHKDVLDDEDIILYAFSNNIKYTEIFYQLSKRLRYSKSFVLKILKTAEIHKEIKRKIRFSIYRNLDKKLMLDPEIIKALGIHNMEDYYNFFDLVEFNDDIDEDYINFCSYAIDLERKELELVINKMIAKQQVR